MMMSMVMMFNVHDGDDVHDGGDEDDDRIRGHDEVLVKQVNRRN